MMADITFETVRIEGVSYKRILDMQIISGVGEHAKCTIMLETESSKAKEFVAHCGVEQRLIITTSAEGHPETIFIGVISHANFSGETGYPVLCIELLSASYLMDQNPIERTYQRISSTYEEIMREAIGNQGTIQFNVSDKVIGNWCYQNGETNWKFIRRMASQCGTDIVADFVSASPRVIVGIPQGNPVNNYYEDINRTERNGVFRTNDTIMIGDTIDTQHYVTFLHSYFLNGVFTTDFMIGYIKEFRRTPYFNPKSEGRMLTGIVQAVEKEKIKVFFDEIDNSFDSGSDAWFEYATPYASAGGKYGSGFYIMPEAGERVRVFLPSANEGTAFAFAAVSSSSLSNTKHARWKVPSGAEILFTNEGIRLTNGNEKIYIDMNMESEVGISVVCDKAIVIDEADEVNIEGKKGVIILADNEVSISNAQNMITIQKEKIVFQGESLHIN